MSKIIKLILVLAIGLFLFACDSSTSSNDDGGNNNKLTDNTTGFIGGWIGTSFAYVKEDNPAVIADLSQFGVTFTVLVREDSTYSATTVFLGQTMLDEGTLFVAADSFYFNSTTMPMRGAYEFADKDQYKDRILFLHIVDQLFDFNQDGEPEAARLEVELEKTN